MTDINGVNKNILDTFGLKDNKDGSEKTGELGQSDFLELLVAQMNNLDPLNPEGSGDFIAQMAQFSQTDGIAKMQKSLEELTASLQSSQALQASALVGKSVLVPSDLGILEASGNLQVSAELPQTATDIRATITASNGTIVNSYDLGVHSAGQLDFSWDGLNSEGQRMPAGTYKISIEGLTDGKNTAFGTLVASNVNSVILGKNGEEMTLNVAGVGNIKLSNVKQIGE